MDSANPQAQDGTQERALVQVRQIRLLYQNLEYGVKLSFIAAVAILLAIGARGPLPVSVMWWGTATILWLGAGYVVHVLYLRARPEDSALGEWGKRAAGGTAIAGAIWGSIGFCSLDPTTQGLEPLFVAVACLLAIGVFAGYFCYLPAMYGFVVGITFTFCLSRLLLGDILELAIAVLLLLTMLFAVISGHRFNRLLSSEIIMRARNAQLIDELTVKQSEVEAANRAKTRFLAAASHDLRQPVHAINLYNEVLREHVPSQDGKAILDRMGHSVRALDGLFESIQDISKFEAGVVTPRLGHFPLERSFAAVRAHYAEIAKARSLQFDVPVASHVVTTDPVLLERILGNLVSNALRYTNSGRVHIEEVVRENSVVVSVCDTGIGIPRDKLTDIFLEFVQLQDARRASSQGLGLGLNIVQRLAKLLDHPLDVTSEVGVGSRFSLTLPLAPAGSADAEHSAETLPDNALEGAFVLVIDDDEEVLRSTELLLRRWRCHVLSAIGDDAIDKVAREQRIPDLILCDLSLRDAVSGIDVINGLRAQLGVATPAIILSGDVDPARVKEAADAGLPMLHKPVNASRLFQVMVEVLRIASDP